MDKDEDDEEEEEKKIPSIRIKRKTDFEWRTIEQSDEEEDDFEDARDDFSEYNEETDGETDLEDEFVDALHDPEYSDNYNAKDYDLSIGASLIRADDSRKRGGTIKDMESNEEEDGGARPKVRKQQALAIPPEVMRSKIIKAWANVKLSFDEVITLNKVKPDLKELYVLRTSGIDIFHPLVCEDEEIKEMYKKSLMREDRDKVKEYKSKFWDTGIQTNEYIEELSFEELLDLYKSTCANLGYEDLDKPMEYTEEEREVLVDEVKKLRQESKRKMGPEKTVRDYVVAYQSDEDSLIAFHKGIKAISIALGKIRGLPKMEKFVSECPFPGFVIRAFGEMQTDMVVVILKEELSRFLPQYWLHILMQEHYDKCYHMDTLPRRKGQEIMERNGRSIFVPVPDVIIVKEDGMSQRVFNIETTVTAGAQSEAFKSKEDKLTRYKLRDHKRMKNVTRILVVTSGEQGLRLHDDSKFPFFIDMNLVGTRKQKIEEELSNHIRKMNVILTKKQFPFDELLKAEQSLKKTSEKFCVKMFARTQDYFDNAANKADRLELGQDLFAPDLSHEIELTPKQVEEFSFTFKPHGDKVDYADAPAVGFRKSYKKENPSRIRMFAMTSESSPGDNKQTILRSYVQKMASTLYDVPVEDLGPDKQSDLKAMISCLKISQHFMDVQEGKMGSVSEPTWKISTKVDKERPRTQIEIRNPGNENEKEHLLKVTGITGMGINSTKNLGLRDMDISTGLSSNLPTKYLEEANLEQFAHNMGFPEIVDKSFIAASRRNAEEMIRRNYHNAYDLDNLGQRPDRTQIEASLKRSLQAASMIKPELLNILTITQFLNQTLIKQLSECKGNYITFPVTVFGKIIGIYTLRKQKSEDPYVRGFCLYQEHSGLADRERKGYEHSDEPGEPSRYVDFRASVTGGESTFIASNINEDYKQIMSKSRILDTVLMMVTKMIGDECTMMTEEQMVNNANFIAKFVLVFNHYMSHTTEGTLAMVFFILNQLHSEVQMMPKKILDGFDKLIINPAECLFIDGFLEGIVDFMKDFTGDPTRQEIRIPFLGETLQLPLGSAITVLTSHSLPSSAFKDRGELKREFAVLEHEVASMTAFKYSIGLNMEITMQVLEKEIDPKSEVCEKCKSKAHEIYEANREQVAKNLESEAEYNKDPDVAVVMKAKAKEIRNGKHDFEKAKDQDMIYQPNQGFIWTSLKRFIDKNQNGSELHRSICDRDGPFRKHINKLSNQNSMYCPAAGTTVEAATAVKNFRRKFKPIKEKKGIQGETIADYALLMTLLFEDSKKDPKLAKTLAAWNVFQLTTKSEERRREKPINFMCWSVTVHIMKEVLECISPHFLKVQSNAQGDKSYEFANKMREAFYKGDECLENGKVANKESRDVTKYHISITPQALGMAIIAGLRNTGVPDVFKKFLLSILDFWSMKSVISAPLMSKSTVVTPKGKRIISTKKVEHNNLIQMSDSELIKMQVRSDLLNTIRTIRQMNKLKGVCFEGQWAKEYNVPKLPMGLGTLNRTSSIITCSVFNMTQEVTNTILAAYKKTKSSYTEPLNMTEKVLFRGHFAEHFQSEKMRETLYDSRTIVLNDDYYMFQARDSVEEVFAGRYLYTRISSSCCFNVSKKSTSCIYSKDKSSACCQMLARSFMNKGENIPIMRHAPASLFVPIEKTGSQTLSSLQSAVTASKEGCFDTYTLYYVLAAIVSSNRYLMSMPQTEDQVMTSTAPSLYILRDMVRNGIKMSSIPIIMGGTEVAPPFVDPLAYSYIKQRDMLNETDRENYVKISQDYIPYYVSAPRKAIANFMTIYLAAACIPLKGEDESSEPGPQGYKVEKIKLNAFSATSNKNASGGKLGKYRDLWKHIGNEARGALKEICPAYAFMNPSEYEEVKLGSFMDIADRLEPERREKVYEMLEESNRRILVSHALSTGRVQGEEFDGLPDVCSNDALGADDEATFLMS